MQKLIQESRVTRRLTKIGIGSTNRVKVRAAQNVLSRIYPRARFLPMEVASGVKIQP